MEILIGLVVLAGLGYLVLRKPTKTDTIVEKSATAEAPYKVEVAPVIVTPAPVVEEAKQSAVEVSAEKPAKAKKPKAAAIKAKTKTETSAKETKPKAIKKPKTLKVAK